MAGAVLLAVSVIALIKARYKLFWLDEIIGVLIAKQPRANDIWAICGSGADGLPPFYHYLTRASIWLFRNDALGLRFPSVLGYTTFLLCVFLFVSRRTSRLYGVFAMLYPGLTGAWYYATEGRPYALVLGCSGIAALCWQSVAIGKWRTCSLLGLALSLMLALNFHFYAVLVFIPLVIAECVRTYIGRRIDASLWGCLLLPLLALAPYWGVIQESRTKFGSWNRFVAPGWFHSPSIFADQFLASSTFAVLGIGCTFLIFRIVLKAPPDTPDLQFPRSRILPELALILAFACLPFLGVPFAKIVTHVLFSRYSMPAVFGVAALLALVLWLGSWGRKEPALISALIMAAAFGHIASADLVQARNAMRSSAERSVESILPQKLTTEVTLPIVVANADTFLRLTYYGNPSLVKRLVYVSSKQLSTQIQGFNFLEQIMIASAPYFGTHVIDYYAFLGEHRTFFVVGGLSQMEWIVPKLIRDNADVQLLQGGTKDTDGDLAEPCFLARMPALADQLPR